MPVSRPLPLGLLKVPRGTVELASHLLLSFEPEYTLWPGVKDRSVGKMSRRRGHIRGKLVTQTATDDSRTYHSMYTVL